MCGIFAYLGNTKNAGDLILEGLKSLEYRGYDSWGIALKTAKGVSLIKHTGKIGNSTLPSVHATSGIGHTRWATHGGVTEANAHPHTNKDKTVIVVHNGIVENYNPLKSLLKKKGYVFVSQTDSEILPHYIDLLIKQGKTPKAAVLETFATIKGMNAIIAFFPEMDEIYAIKNGSPLVYAQTENEQLLASDAAALVPYTRKVAYIEDNELLEMKRGNIPDLSFTELPYYANDAVLGKHKHFMMKEIAEQPSVLTTISLNDTPILELAAAIKKAYGAYLIGCGTAFYACLGATYLFSKIASRHINASIGSEFGYHMDFITEKSLVIALSQSGETIDIISSLKKVKEKKATIAAVTNVLGSSLYRMADIKTLINAGPEKSVCATKSFTAKIATLFLTAHAINGTLEQGKKELAEAITAVVKILKNKNKIKTLSQRLAQAKNIFILGRGVSYPIALESALKIKEVSYLHAEGFAGGELKHGVIALIEKNTPVIIYNPEDETYDDTLSSAYEVKARGAFVIGISSKKSDVFDVHIPVGVAHEAAMIPHVVVSQLIGYYIALEKNLDPDKPRNLAKSVVVK